MKILLMLLINICSFIYQPTYTDDFTIDLKEKEVIADDNIKINDNGNISFYFNSLHLCNIKCINYAYLIDGEYFYIIFIDDNILYLRKYDTNAKLVKNVKFNDSLFTDSSIKILKKDNNLVLFSTVKNNNYTDLSIIELDDKLNVIKNKFISGELDDKFIDCVIENDYYYLLASHDKMSGGELGYGGNLVLSLMDLDYNITKNLYFKENNAKICINNDATIDLITDKSIYSYDLSLNQKLGFEFPFKSLFLAKSFNDLYLSLQEDKLNIYEILFNKEDNKNELHLLKTYEYNLENKYLIDVIELNKHMYLKFSDDLKEYFYELKIFDTREFIESVNYLSSFNEINKYVDSWYERLNLNKDDDHFNCDVYGEYEVKYYIDDFEKIAKIKVLEEANVEEGMIYPLNYKLYFTGVALLNNKMVHNNYSLDKAGKYSLELYSNTKERKIINFIVEDNQTYFQDFAHKASDFTAYVNQDVNLEYRLDTLNEINQLIIDNQAYFDYTFLDHILRIKFKHDESGFYHHVINYIDDIKVNEIISFNILAQDDKLNFDIKEERKTIKLHFYNDDKNLRCFSLYLDDKFYKNYPLSDNNIILPYEANFKIAKIVLTYANLDGTYSSYDLASFVLNDNKTSDLLNIEINKKEDVIKEFSLIIKNKNNIEKIKYDDKIIYETKDDTSNASIYLLVCCVILNIISYSYYLIKVLKINIKNIKLFKKKTKCN